MDQGEEGITLEEKMEVAAYIHQLATLFQIALSSSLLGTVDWYLELDALGDASEEDADSEDDEERVLN